MHQSSVLNWLAVGTLFLVLGSTAIAIALLSLGNPAWAATEVNVYSARKEALIKPLLDEFTKTTGTKVNLVTGKADALLQRLKSEGKHTPADLLITVDAGRLHRAKAAGLLQPAESKVFETTVPAAYRDPEKYWVGLSLRARPIMYSKDRVKANEITSYEDLADSKWRGRICIRSSNNIYNQSLVASLIAAHGEEKTLAWAKGLVANLARAPKGGDRDQIKAAAAGQCDIAVANTYYLGGMLHSKHDNERQAANKVAVLWPNQSGRGAHVNISGAGVTHYAKHKEAAIKLLEFLLNESSQKFYAEKNYEYPIRADVAFKDPIGGWGNVKTDPLNLAKLGENNAAAVKLMDRAGWR